METRIKTDFEKFIDHMIKRRSSDRVRLKMLKEMINEGMEFLSPEALNYLIGEFNKIAGNDDKLPYKMPF